MGRINGPAFFNFLYDAEKFRWLDFCNRSLTQVRKNIRFKSAKDFLDEIVWEIGGLGTIELYV